MATETSPLFSAQPVPYSLSSHVTNSRSLEAAVDAAAEFLNQVGHLPLYGGASRHVALHFALDGSCNLLSTFLLAS